MIWVKRILCCYLMLSLTAAPLLAQSSPRIAPGDVLRLKVPERADLDRQLTVQPNGSITMPLVGTVTLSGLTIAEAERTLLAALQQYYPSVRRVELSLRASGGDLVYVIGQVGEPGKYNVTEGMSVWEAIREAGGANSDANLDQVRVVKDLRKGGGSSVVNVAAAIENGTVDQLPILEPGDTVIIPEKEKTYSGSSGVNVFGAVSDPGVYKLQGKEDLITALLQAGGPTERASLGDLKVIRERPDGSVVTFDVDFKRYLELGDPVSNPLLKPGDSVNVPEQNQFAFLFGRQFVLVVTTAIALTALVINSGR